MKKTAITAACRFCGQMTQLEGYGELTEAQAEEEATVLCKCEAAKEYQKRKQRKGKALENIQKLFGEGVLPEKRAGEGIINLLNAGTEEVYNGGLAKITLNLRGGGKSLCIPKQQGGNQCGADRHQKTEDDGIIRMQCQNKYM